MFSISFFFNLYFKNSFSSKMLCLLDLIFSCSFLISIFLYFALYSEELHNFISQSIRIFISINVFLILKSSSLFSESSVLEHLVFHFMNKIYLFEKNLA